MQTKSLEEDGNSLVVIVLATYNGERYLAEQLQSISNQTYSNWHLFISDDGSSDRTRQIVEEFGANHPGKLTYSLHKGEGGACANFLSALKRALNLFESEYFAFCDQDDYWEPMKLGRSVKEIRRLENKCDRPALVFSDAIVANESLSVISRSFFDYTGVNSSRVQLNELLVQNPISGASMMLNRPLTEIVCYSDIDASIWMHDQWVGLIASCFGEIAVINEPLYKYRQHDDNAMGARQMSLGTVIEKARSAKNSLAKKQRQARYLLDVYTTLLPKEQRAILEQFCSISSRTKVGRIYCCVKNSFSMNGILRNIGLLLYI